MSKQEIEEAVTRLVESDEDRPHQMTQREFIERYRNSFVVQKGRRVIQGVLVGPSVYPMPQGSQHGGKLTRPPEDILAEIHRGIVAGAVKLWREHEAADAFAAAGLPVPVSYTHLTLPTN